MIPAVFTVVSNELHTDEDDLFFVYDDATGKPISRGSRVVGNPTIGVGRNLATRGITRAESDVLLANDCDEIEMELITRLPWLPNQTPNRQAAVYSLFFNVAEGNPAGFVAKWPHFLAQMAAGQYDQAATNLETSQPWATEVGARATRLANLIRHG